VRFNPCGLACDIGRRPYRTLFRPFRDSDLVVPIRWYKVPMGTPFLPFPSRIVSLDWVAEPWTATGVGEVFLAPRKFATWNSPHVPPGGHFCGTPQDFAEGGLFQPLDPLVGYTAGGLPTCCGDNIGVQVGGGLFVQAGGVLVGGGQLVEPIAGGVLVGGASSPATAGGVLVGGDWGEVPPPGTDCVTAGEILFDTDYERTVFAGTDQWFKLPVVATTYHLTMTNVDPEGDVEFALWGGVCPGSLTPIALTHGIGTDCWEFELFGVGEVWLQFSVATGAADYTFRAATGAC